MVFAQRAEVPIQALDTLFVGFDALSFQALVELFESQQ